MCKNNPTVLKPDPFWNAKFFPRTNTIEQAGASNGFFLAPGSGGQKSDFENEVAETKRFRTLTKWRFVVVLT